MKIIYTTDIIYKDVKTLLKRRQGNRNYSNKYNLNNRLRHSKSVRTLFRQKQILHKKFYGLI